MKASNPIWKYGLNFWDEAAALWGPLWFAKLLILLP